MYTAISTVFTLITSFMFLRMHHIHGSDTNLERLVITVGAIVFLIQAGLVYQSFSALRNKTKRAFTLLCIFFTIAYGSIFFLVADFNADSVFSELF